MLYYLVYVEIQTLAQYFDFIYTETAVCEREFWELFIPMQV